VAPRPTSSLTAATPAEGTRRHHRAASGLASSSRLCSTCNARDDRPSTSRSRPATPPTLIDEQTETLADRRVRAKAQAKAPKVLLRLMGRSVDDDEGCREVGRGRDSVEIERRSARALDGGDHHRRASARPALAAAPRPGCPSVTAVIARFADAGSPFPKIPTLESASWKAGADAGCHERCHPEHFRKSAGRRTPLLATSPRESGFVDREASFRSQPGRS